MKRAGVILAIGAVVLIAWTGYKATLLRALNGRAAGDLGCETDSSTIAYLSELVPSGPSVRCQPWDIGTGVAGFVWTAPNPRAVVLIEHGWGDYSQRYVRQVSRLVPQLLARGISVYAIDMWGNGRSPGKRGVTDIAAAIDDHLAARRTLRQQSLPVFVLGHSVGGLVTATSVVRDQTDVAGMLLIAPTLKWGISDALRIVGRVGAFVVPSFAVPGPASDPADQSRDAGFIERITHDPLYYSGKISWLSAGTGAATAHENWKAYRRITIPVLVVNGSADSVTPPDGNRAFIDSLGSRDKTLIVVEGGRHSLLDDPPSDAEALQAILTWLDRQMNGLGARQHF